MTNKVRNDELITIIVPVYKTEQYLRRCVDSIIEQSYTNIEILLVDDGSPDSCPQICDEYAAKDKRVTVVHKENGGLSSARNAGMDKCHGKYVAFVDSDDYVHQRYIEYLYRAVKLNDSEISMCDLEYTYLKNDKKRKKTVEFSNEIMSGKEAALGYLKNDGQKYICPCNKLYSIDLFDNLRFPIGKLSEDAYVQYKLFFSVNQVSVINEKLYFYYQNRDSIMHVNDTLSDYNLEALKYYARACKDAFSSEEYHTIQNDIRLKCMDYITEDYWRARQNKNMPRMQEMNRQYKTIRHSLIKNGGRLKLKFKLFDIHPVLFVIARYGFEAKKVIIGLLMN